MLRDHQQPRGTVRNVQTLLRRPPRAFTLLELAVVSGITAVVFLVLMQWVSSLLSVSSSGLDTSALQRDVNYATNVLETDVEASSGCRADGLDGPLYSIEANVVWMYADVVTSDNKPGTDGKVDLVGWRKDQDGEVATLQRTSLPGDGSCTFDTTRASWSTMTGGLVPGNAATFVGQSDGKDQPGRYGTCTGRDAEKCLFDGIAVRFTSLSSGDQQYPLTTRMVIPLDLTSSRLA